MSVSLTREQLDRMVEEERKRLENLPSIPYDLNIHRMGVLLSDEIQYYRDNFNLIDPWEPSCLRPAGYDLRVGSNVSINGKNEELREFQSITIGPYQVAIIETYETLNMPRFLIGRWNIRVALAYDGLLWVGGAQVDPGFRGHLACPIYNLSDKNVSLAFKQPIAMLDFVTTTKLTRHSLSFDWANRKKVVFWQYGPGEADQRNKTTRIEGRLSTLEEKTKTDISATADDSKQALLDVRQKMDTFVAMILAVLSVLVAGLGVIATRQPSGSVLVAPVCISTLALYISMRSRSGLKTRWLPFTIILLIVVGAIIYDVRTQASASDQVEDTLSASRKATESATQTVNEIKSQNENLRIEMESLRLRIENLQDKAARVQGVNPPTKR